MKQLAAHFSPVMKQAHTRWQGLEQRERYLLSGLGVLLLVTFLWLGIWKPLHDGVAEAEQRLRAQQSYQRWFERQAQFIYQSQAALKNNAQGGQAAIASDELSAFLNKTTSELKLKITRIQTQNDAQVLVFEEAEFDAILVLVQRLAERGVRVESLDLSETTTPGVVRVRRLQVKVEA